MGGRFSSEKIGPGLFFPGNFGGEINFLGKTWRRPIFAGQFWWGNQFPRKNLEAAYFFRGNWCDEKFCVVLFCVSNILFKLILPKFRFPRKNLEAAYFFRGNVLEKKFLLCTPTGGWCEKFLLCTPAGGMK